jgi:selenocysteine lyase/cysteine desulfurase
MATAVDLRTYRDLFPITDQYAYLNHASFGPLPAPVGQALEGFIRSMQGIGGMVSFDEIHAIEEGMRERSAALIGAARADEIVQVPGTATGINIAARSLPLRPGDNVLVVDGDYPAVIYPWLNIARDGILTKIVPQVDGGLDLDVLESRMDSRTRVVALSTAMFATGFRNDIEAVGRLCRDRGIYVVVDAIQTLGYLPIDVQACHIDFLACGSHKWLLSPPGSGILYCRHDLLDDLQPGAYVGAGSVVDMMNFLDYNFTLQPSSARWAISAPNFLGIIGLHASMGLLLDIGIEQIAERVLALASYAMDELEKRGLRVVSNQQEQHRSGIVVVEVANPQAACQRLTEAGIMTAVRGRGIRLSPHFYNTEEEITRAVEVLAD